MITVLQIFFVLALIIVIILFVFGIRRAREPFSLPENYKELLSDYVKFYQQLNDDEKTRFEDRIQHFLSAVQITGVNAEVEDLDRILIASGAIIPVFTFSDWQ